MFRIHGAGQQIDGLNHMGMAAGNHIHTQIAQLLRHGLLVVADIGRIVITPVDVENDGIGTVGAHGSDFAFNLCVELAEFVVVKGID